MVGWIIAGVMTAALIACVFFAVKIILSMYTRQAQFEEELEERVDSSLAVLDSCYMEMAAVANKPVFFDSPEVRTVVKAIQKSRDAVLHVIHVLDDIDIEDKTDDVKPPDVEYIDDDDDVVNDMLESAATEQVESGVKLDVTRRQSAAAVAVNRRKTNSILRKAPKTRG